MQLNYSNIARLLSHGEPQAYAMREDGTMVVIAEDGKKLIFTPQEVKEAELLNKPPFKQNKSIVSARPQAMPEKPPAPATSLDASPLPATSSQPQANKPLTTSHKPRAKKP